MKGIARWLAVLRIPDFRYLIGARFFMTVGTQMLAVIVGWQIYQLTHDPLALGLVGLSEAAAFIGFALLAGHTADRREKRLIILLSQSGLFLAAVLFMGMSGMHHIRVYYFYLLMALTGLARSFLWSSSIAFSEIAVPREIYSTAAAWNATTWEIGAVTGPALGGLLYELSGPRRAYGAVALCFLAALLSAVRLARRPPDPRVDQEIPSSSFLSGMRYVLSKPLLLSAMSVDMVAVLFGGAVALLPIFAERLQVGPSGLGVLRAAPAIGAMGMSLVQAMRPPFEKAGRALFSGVALYGLAIIGFALSHNFIWSIVLLAVSGMADNVSVVIRASIMQAMTPDHMRGRVSAVNGIFIGSSNEIGEFESGVAARLMGTVPSVIFGGVMTLVTIAVALWKAPELRDLGKIV